jgi:type II secretory pathway component PulL
MKRAGFLDLTSVAGEKPAGTFYVFNVSAGKYEFESPQPFPDDGISAFSPADMDECVLSLPLEQLNFRVLKLPFDDREKLLKVIPFELENLIMESSDAVIFDPVVLGGSGDTFDVLVPYIEKRVLKGILENCASGGIDPAVVTSLGLRALLGGGHENIALRLVNPGEMAPDERITAAGEELLKHTINLRTGPFAYTKDAEKTRKTLKVTVTLLILLALMINAYLAFGIITSKVETAGVRRELRNAYAGLFPNEKKITDELYQMKSHMKEIKEKGDALVGVQPLQFLLDLSQKTPQGIMFYEITLDKGLITLKGEASSMGDVDKVKTRLSEVLKDVSVADIKPSTGGKTLFTLVAKGRKT